MPFNLTCPTCKQTLIVPSKRAGTYATCPSCKGRLWVPVGGASNGAPSGELRTPDPAVKSSDPGSGSGNGQGGWSPPLAAGSPLAGVRVAQAAPAAAGPVPPAPPAPPPPPAVAPVPPLVTGRRTARFVSTAAPSTGIQPAADGKLPELQLEDASRTVEAKAKGKAVSPLVLFSILSLSVALSIAAVLIDFNAPSASRSQRKADVRRAIEAQYFPLAAEHGAVKAPERYQLYLAEATRAYARGDRPTERRMYSRVLDLLRTERDKFQRGLTGSRERDKQLEALITVLLTDD
jgi:hypothetical protein